jgi:hypothetical protein
MLCFVSENEIFFKTKTHYLIGIISGCDRTPTIRQTRLRLLQTVLPPLQQARAGQQQGQVPGKDRVLPPRFSRCGQIGNYFFG